MRRPRSEGRRSQDERLIERLAGDDQDALYFSVSLWRARGLLGNNNVGHGEKTSDPYVLIK